MVMRIQCTWTRIKNIYPQQWKWYFTLTTPVIYRYIQWKWWCHWKASGESTGWYSTFGGVTQWPGVWFLRVGKPPISLELQMAWGFQPPTLRIQGQSQVALNWYVCMHTCVYIDNIYIIGKYIYIYYIALHCITLILRIAFTFTFTFTFTLFTYIHDCCPSCKSLLVGSSTQ